MEYSKSVTKEKNNVKGKILYTVIINIPLPADMVVLLPLSSKTDLDFGLFSL